jgi:parvulin-like peptidyl-prolyl isomerase
MRLWVLGAAALAVATAVCASGCKGAPGSKADAGAASGSLGTAAASQVLARVGERTITLGDYVAALDHMDQFDRDRYEAPERRRELLAEMIDVMLLADEARTRGYDKDAVTQQELREILRDAMLKKARGGAPEPSDIPANEVRAYYDAHLADFRDPERRRVSAIVVSNEAVASAALAAASKATAAQWGELVRTKSIEPQAKPNPPIDLAGDLGFVSPPGDPRGTNPRVPEEVRVAAFEIATVGDVLSHVVKAGNKFYVVKLASRTEARERSLQDAERVIRVKLTQDAIRAREAALIDDLRKRYPVQIDEAALGQVRVQPPDAGGTRAP